MLISLTVGKVDAGVAVLLTEDKRLIEFPSILLPSSISSGSIVDITVSRNYASEKTVQESFSKLQGSIFSTYGQSSPTAPILRCRNATQTSVVLEWDPIELATADIRSLSLYRNGVKAGTIPRPLEQTSTKLSGLAIDQEFTFHLVLRTSAGIYSSEKLKVRTHKMTDLSGITVTPGSLPTQLRDSLATAVERIGAKMIDTVRIDTTHFICIEGKGKEWEKAVENNIPVVRPEWIEGCEREGRIVGVRGYYLNADPRLRQVGQSVSGATAQTQRRDSQPGLKSKQISSHTGEALASHARTNSEPPEPPEKDVDQRTQHIAGGASQQSFTQTTSPRPELAGSPDVSSRGDEEESDTATKKASDLRIPNTTDEASTDDDNGDGNDPGEGTFSDVAL